MQMVGFFARRIVVVSGGGSGPSALSRAATLQNRAVEAAQAPATSKSRRFVCIGTSSKSPQTVALPGAECRVDVICADLKPRWEQRCHGRSISDMAGSPDVARDVTPYTLDRA